MKANVKSNPTSCNQIKATKKINHDHLNRAQTTPTTHKIKSNLHDVSSPHPEFPSLSLSLPLSDL